MHIGGESAMSSLFNFLTTHLIHIFTEGCVHISEVLGIQDVRNQIQTHRQDSARP